MTFFAQRSVGRPGIGLNYFIDEQPDEVAAVVGMGRPYPLTAGAMLNLVLHRRQLANKLEELILEHEKRTKQALDIYLPMSKELLQISFKLYDEAKREADRSTAVATWAQRIAVVFYMIGTFLVIYGKAKEIDPDRWRGE